MSTRLTKSPVSPNAVILLVDDNRAGLAARRVVLEELGYTATGVSNPREALELLRTKHFDLVVTDYMMPEMTGGEFIRVLREQMPNLPVVLLSGYVDALGLNEKTTGASAVIMKSNHEVAHLARAVKNLLKAKPAARKKPPAKETPASSAKRSRAAS